MGKRLCFLRAETSLIAGLGRAVSEPAEDHRQLPQAQHQEQQRGGDAVFRGAQGGPLAPGMVQRAMARARISLGLPPNASASAVALIVGGCLVTGNEDGIKHCAMNLLYSLQHLGYVIPPQADSGWIGEAGPGDSYGDNGAGYDNDFTQRNTTFMAWNLMHLARLILMSASGQVPSQAKRRRIFRHRLAIGKQTLQSTFRIARSHLVLKLLNRLLVVLEPRRKAFPGAGSGYLLIPLHQ